MNTIIVILLLGIAILIIGLLSNKTQGESFNQSPVQELRPYISKSPLTPTEMMFYHRLIEALPNFIVLAQVQLSSFLKVDETQTNYQNYLKWFQPISQQSVDFLICEKNFSIVAAVELDDKSHLRTKSIERDNKKTNNLNAANVPLIRWHAEAMPETDTIRQTIFKYTSGMENTILSQPEWLAGNQPAFFTQRHDPIKPILRNIILWLVIALIVMWGMSETKRTAINPSSHQNDSTQPLNRQELRTQDILTKQQQERSAQEATKIQMHQAQQVVIQQQEQQKLLKAHETTMKEDAWNQSYKKTVECSVTEDMVTCGNRYIRNRQQFEKNWEIQQSNLK
ncbi:MAG: DUF2726 domain-containing protein [Methylotenera sp.]|nr:DUF2726 domain-containing protein [Methylotenera sp.]MDP1754675.1 DUF2726 domain-containing protein [Methylotenera sp.]MDP1959792.1 DUF2726 domain-containing protein [Methylotenera sp.]MDP3087128.1 DUF2726 domain-containing protein [Methylotenera sp.]MDP3942628.1 DUF2726 domain-containing protein [Methylotenera sp.]